MICLQDSTLYSQNKRNNIYIYIYMYVLLLVVLLYAFFKIITINIIITICLLPRPNPDAREAQLFRVACRLQPRFGRFPMINGTLKKWRNLNKHRQSFKMKNLNKPPILQNEEIWYIFSNFPQINAPTKKEQTKATNPSFFCGEKTKLRHGLRFTGPRPWMSGTVILGQVEVFPKTNLPFFRWVEKSVKCDDLLFRKRYKTFVKIISKNI